MLISTIQTGLKKSFLIKEILNTKPITYKIKDLNGEEIIGTFYNEELKKKKNEEDSIKICKR